MREKKILLDHGSGGKVAHAMMKEMILPLFANPLLEKMDDAAVFNVKASDMASGNVRMAFSTDSYVVDPIFFPGGNIGDLAINGTVNDVAMCGGDPKYISVALMIEEGFLEGDLRRILKSMKQAADKAGIDIVTGDTKVLPRGKVDKIFINTSGVGVIPDGVMLSGNLAQPGDKVIVSGTIADHGITVLSSREGLGLASDIESDSAPLNGMVRSILKGTPQGTVHVLRDPTRGGVATTLNEIAGQSFVTIKIKEVTLPIKPAVQGVCELLGFDPLYVANEGKLLAVVASEVAEDVLAIIRSEPYGTDAAIIGEVLPSDLKNTGRAGRVLLETVIGGTRIVDMLTGEQLPRIC